MKVYLVIESDWEWSEVRAIYSTRADAELHLAHGKPSRRIHHVVEEHDVWDSFSTNRFTQRRELRAEFQR